MPETPDPSEVVPTERDLENARLRQEIADKMRSEYAQVLAWAEEAFGLGPWIPRGRHYLVEKDEENEARRTGTRPRAAATVYTVRTDSLENRHFTVEDGKVVEHESYQLAFGDMLLELHPSRGFEHKGTFHPVHKYSLNWGGFELYHPRTADELAALRASREKKREERADKQFADDHPLFVQAGITRKDG